MIAGTADGGLAGLTPLWGAWSGLERHDGIDRQLYHKFNGPPGRDLRFLVGRDHPGTGADLGRAVAGTVGVVERRVDADAEPGQTLANLLADCGLVLADAGPCV